ncbi:MAG TPA: hypothetical protein QF480_00830 [Bacteroidales bacterium]|nr:hypothetical protein [Bacteroidales bacterium]
MVNTSGKSPEAEIPEVQHAPTSSATNVDPATLKTEGVADRRAEQVARQDEMKNAARVRASLQRPMRIKNLKQHLIEYWGLEDVKEIERVQFVETCNLPPQHQKGYDFLNDNRLAGTMIAVVPDDMWIKGDQPS